MDSIVGIISLRLVMFVICCILSDMQYNYMLDCYASVACIYQKIIGIIKCVLYSNLNYSLEKQNSRK